MLTTELRRDSRSLNVELLGSFKSAVYSLSNLIVDCTLIPEANKDSVSRRGSWCDSRIKNTYRNIQHKTHLLVINCKKIPIDGVVEKNCPVVSAVDPLEMFEFVVKMLLCIVVWNGSAVYSKRIVN